MSERFSSDVRKHHFPARCESCGTLLMTIQIWRGHQQTCTGGSVTSTNDHGNAAIATGPGATDQHPPGGEQRVE